ncbi:hypothetical protein [Aneurinibacillus tyrosinisolvens]|uniref:hypothetical protein n=1 Tax=Aneurinibacillus tyrosinisolvens TaxID=1443435 RepID=UPI00063F0A32|nr:hypothetical protein [Aneurinibacillus tyrosinisolvens]
MLKRVEMTWDQVFEFNKLDVPALESEGGKLLARQNRYTPHMMMLSITGINTEEVGSFMTRIRHMVQGRCLSLKFYFDAAEGQPRNTIVPLDELKRLGFVSTNKNIWEHKDHPDFSIAAIAIPAFTEAEWVLQIDKRNAKGVPSSAADFINLFSQQMKLDLDVAGVA